MNFKFLKSKTFKYLLSAIFTVLCVYLIFDLVDFSGFGKSLRKLSYGYLFIAAVALLVSYFFRVLRYEYILNVKNSRIKLFAISSIHYFLNKILPARTGEISLPILLKKHLGSGYKKGISALLFFRILDFFAMIFLFFVSAFFVKTKQINMIYTIIISAFIILIFILVWFFLENILTLIIRFFNKIHIKKTDGLKQKIIKIFEAIGEYKKNKNKFFIYKVVIISILNWVAIYFYYYFIILSFNFSQNYFQTLFAATISNFTFILPINAIGNIGPFEGAWAIGFYLIGVGKEISVPVGLFSNVFATFFTGILALTGIISLKIKKNKLKIE